jgi:hypothetical protein
MPCHYIVVYIEATAAHVFLMLNIRHIPLVCHSFREESLHYPTSLFADLAPRQVSNVLTMLAQRYIKISSLIIINFQHKTFIKNQHINCIVRLTTLVLVPLELDNVSHKREWFKKYDTRCSVCAFENVNMHILQDLLWILLGFRYLVTYLMKPSNLEDWPLYRRSILVSITSNQLITVWIVNSLLPNCSCPQSTYV